MRQVALSVLKEYDLLPDEGFMLDGEVGDYGPYRQSDRIDIYKSYAKMLVENAKAYPCFCEAPEGKSEVLEKVQNKKAVVGEMEKANNYFN